MTRASAITPGAMMNGVCMAAIAISANSTPLAT